MPLASPLLALIYRARSQGVHLRVQVNFPNPSLLRTAGVRTFLIRRGLLRRCQLVAEAISSWAFCLHGHQVGSSVGVVGSSPCQHHSQTSLTTLEQRAECRVEHRAQPPRPAVQTSNGNQSPSTPRLSDRMDRGANTWPSRPLQLMDDVF